ncbi:MAG: hypothetical protein HY767_01960, partial [Candidatus Omnitrophica bacterium]|nr:hypothetical protein [Candidatus Omnitrophota bacterium]
TVSESASASANEESAPASGKSETLKITAVAQPVQVAMVHGDYHNFEAQNWQNRGYSGGIKDFSLRYASGDDVTVDMDGHAIMGNNDYKGSATVTKKDVGYLKTDFKQFRKYYDTHGGVYYPFTTSGTASSTPTLNRDLFLDIGHFGVEAGMTRPDLPNVSVYYEHDYKDGAKSMLDWGRVTEGPANDRKAISPSWKEIHETTDTFGVKADHTHKGYHLTAGQRWDISRWKTREYRQMLSDDGNATDSAQIRQNKTVEANSMTTTLGADKWYLSDKIYASSAYRFQHLKNQDKQSLLTFNPDGTQLFNGSDSTPTKPDGIAHNKMELNSWVLNLMANPRPWVSGNARFKAEVLRQDSDFYNPQDSTPVGAVTGVTDFTSKGLTNSNIYRFGESFGVRFKAIPRTALYSELEFQQSQNRLIQDLTYIPGEAAAPPGWWRGIAGRNAVISQPTTTWTTGGNFMPWRFLNFTSQFRFRDAQTKLDEQSAYPLPLTTAT